MRGRLATLALILAVGVGACSVDATRRRGDGSLLVPTAQAGTRAKLDREEIRSSMFNGGATFRADRRLLKPTKATTISGRELRLFNYSSLLVTNTKFGGGDSTAVLLNRRSLTAAGPQLTCPGGAFVVWPWVGVGCSSTNQWFNPITGSVLFKTEWGTNLVASGPEYGVFQLSRDLIQVVNNRGTKLWTHEGGLMQPSVRADTILTFSESAEASKTRVEMRALADGEVRYRTTMDKSEYFGVTGIAVAALDGYVVGDSSGTWGVGTDGKVVWRVPATFMVKVAGSTLAEAKAAFESPVAAVQASPRGAPLEKLVTATFVGGTLALESTNPAKPLTINGKPLSLEPGCVVTPARLSSDGMAILGERRCGHKVDSVIIDPSGPTIVQALPPVFEVVTAELAYAMNPGNTITIYRLG